MLTRTILGTPRKGCPVRTAKKGFQPSFLVAVQRCPASNWLKINHIRTVLDSVRFPDSESVRMELENTRTAGGVR
jgi:hypothetical protein